MKWPHLYTLLQFLSAMLAKLFKYLNKLWVPVTFGAFHVCWCWIEALFSERRSHASAFSLYYRNINLEITINWLVDRQEIETIIEKENNICSPKMLTGCILLQTLHCYSCKMTTWIPFKPGHIPQRSCNGAAPLCNSVDVAAASGPLCPDFWVECSLHRLIAKFVLWELSALFLHRTTDSLYKSEIDFMLQPYARCDFFFFYPIILLQQYYQIIALEVCWRVFFFFSFSKSSSLCSSKLMDEGQQCYPPHFCLHPCCTAFQTRARSSLVPPDRTSVSIREYYWCAAVSACLPPSLYGWGGGGGKGTPLFSTISHIVHIWDRSIVLYWTICCIACDSLNLWTLLISHVFQISYQVQLQKT